MGVLKRSNSRNAERRIEHGTFSKRETLTISPNIVETSVAIIFPWHCNYVEVNSRFPVCSIQVDDGVWTVLHDKWVTPSVVTWLTDAVAHVVLLPGKSGEPLDHIAVNKNRHMQNETNLTYHSDDIKT